MAMRHWPAFQLIFFVVCSRFSTQQRGPSPVYLVQRISVRRIAGLHWLRAAERIKFKLATLMFRCLHGTAPHYLSANFIRVADVPARRRLRSSTTNSLIVRQTLTRYCWRSGFFSRGRKSVELFYR